MQGVLGRQIEAERQALERDAMNMRGGVLRQEPSMLQTIGSQAKRLFFGDKNMYGNDPLQPSVMDSQYVRPEMAEGAVLDVVGGPMATAFHGSPHKFSKFDMSKIGTGEGHHAYGHGLYFAENPNVAKEYQKKFAHHSQALGRDRLKKYFKEGNIVPSYGGTDRVIKFNEWEGKPPYTFDGWNVDVRAVERKGGEWVDSGRTRSHATLPSPEDYEKVTGDKASHLYKVDIPDEHIDNMLDWDIPFDKQPEKIKNIFKNTSGGYRTDGDNDYIFQEWVKSPRGSIDLMQSGIKGIKYLDQFSRGKYHVQLKYKGEPYGEPVTLHAKNQVDDFVKEYQDKGFGTEVVDLGTSNFVVFDDQIPQILEINDKPLKGVLSGQ